MPQPNWQNKERKHGRSILAKKNHNNIVVWQINSRETLLIKINKDLNRVLTMILDMRIIYTKYLNQANNANKKCKQICTIALELEQKRQINNNKKNEAITLLETQVGKSNQYKKIINILQNFLLAKKN